MNILYKTFIKWYIFYIHNVFLFDIFVVRDDKHKIYNFTRQTKYLNHEKNPSK